MKGTTARMRILIGCEVFYPYLYGGGEVFAYHVARNLAKLGHDVHVICPQRSLDDPLDVRAPSTVDEVHVHRVRGEFSYGSALRSLPYLLRLLRESSRLVKEFDIEIINPQLFRPCLPLYVASQMNGVPCVLTVFDIYSAGRLLGLENSLRVHGHVGVFAWSLEQSILRLPYDRLMTNSFSVRRKLVRYFSPERIDVVNCGVDIEAFPRERPLKIPGRILYLGRLVRYKNPMDLVKAVAVVRRRMPNVSVVIAGSGPLESQMAKIEARTKNITFVRRPSHTQKIRLLREAEVLVLPSSEEGFGITLLEANASYTPFVCYDIPALRELTAALKGGLLAVHGDIDDLANKILILLENAAMARGLAENGRRAVENERFSWRHVASRVEEVYLRALSMSPQQ
jgi:glycosyltransferase involved in cell wall biosynthesis